MSVTVGGTSITFNDGTTQTTAAGGIPSAGGIGSYIIGRPANLTNYSAGDTIAGSSLYAFPVSTRFENGYGTACLFLNSSTTGSIYQQTGTWRCMSTAPYSSGFNASFPGLWVRYA